MTEVRIQTPSMWGGVNTQPAEYRRVGQVEDACNVAFSIVDGASKRPGSVYMFRPDPQFTADANIRLHYIDRDEVEQYLVAYGDSVLRVFRLDGTEATVTYTDAAAQTYYQSNSPTPDDIAMVSIADYTIIVNRTVAVGTIDGEAYTVDETVEDYDVMLTYAPTGGIFYETLNATSTDPIGFFRYLLEGDDNEFARFECFNASEAWSSPAGAWAVKGDVGFKVRVQRQALAITGGTLATGTLTSVGAFASYAIESGDEIDLDGTWYTIATRVSDDAITITSPPADGSYDTTGISQESEITENFQTTAASSMFQVAARLTANAPTGMLINWNPNTGASTGKFEIVSQFRGAGTKVFAPTAPDSPTFNLTSTSGDRPFRGGTATDGTGTPSSDRDTDPGARWERLSAPGDDDVSPDPNTMPIQLVRKTINPLAFEVSLIDWKTRLTGDKFSNPIPSLWENARQIADVSFHRNRFVIAGDENVIFSQAGDFFNFFLEDPESLVDSDPIDLTLTSNSVTKITNVQPFRRSLLIFTAAGEQFELNAPELLTPETAAISPSTSYRLIDTVRPVPMGDRIYFVGPKKDYGVLWEYFYDDTRVNNYAEDVSAHYEERIEQDLRTIQSSPNNGTIMVLPVDSNKLHVWRTHFTGLERQQSAWTRWCFDDDYRIADVALRRNIAYMLIEGPGGWIFEGVAAGRDEVEDDDDLFGEDTTTTTTTTSVGQTTTTTTTTTFTPPTTAAELTTIQSQSGITPDDSLDPTTTASTTTTTTLPACDITVECNGTTCSYSSDSTATINWTRADPNSGDVTLTYEGTLPYFSSGPGFISFQGMGTRNGVGVILRYFLVCTDGELNGQLDDVSASATLWPRFSATSSSESHGCGGSTGTASNSGSNWSFSATINANCS